MSTSQRKKAGFALVELLIIVVVIAAVAAVVFFVVSKNKTSDEPITSQNAESVAKSSEVKIKHLGVNLDYYDPATNKAGDFEFTKEKMSFNRLFFEYGFVVPANSVGPEKRNPQPTFILPLGSKVYALVDGTVEDVPKLYSDDYSIMLRAEGSDLIFETEHVVKVKVKKGDTVKAGDVIAEVSGYDAKNYAGMGLVEIGILKAGNPPSHICPFDYLDESIKAETFKKITALQKSWEEYIGDATVHDEAAMIVPGCLSRDPIEG